MITSFDIKNKNDYKKTPLLALCIGYIFDYRGSTIVRFQANLVLRIVLVLLGLT